MKPAVFLDRDGVLTEEEGYICRKEDLRIFDYSAECVRKIKEMGYYAIVITNQSGVARGFFSEQALKEMNDLLFHELGVDAIYYCPHYMKGDVKKYAIRCNCRKPKTGLIKQACKDFEIDIKRSFVVGDRATDILLGIDLGIPTVLLESGYGTARLEQDVKADYILQDLRDFLEILEKEQEQEEGQKQEKDQKQEQKQEQKPEQEQKQKQGKSWNKDRSKSRSKRRNECRCKSRNKGRSKCRSKYRRESKSRNKRKSDNSF